MIKVGRYRVPMYKNIVRRTEIFLKFLLFYLANKEIQSGKIQNNIYFFNFPTPFSAEFPRSQDKREGNSMLFSTLILYISTLGRY